MERSRMQRFAFLLFLVSIAAGCVDSTAKSVEKNSSIISDGGTDEGTDEDPDGGTDTEWCATVDLSTDVEIEYPESGPIVKIPAGSMVSDADAGPLDSATVCITPYRTLEEMPGYDPENQTVTGQDANGDWSLVPWGALSLNIADSIGNPLTLRAGGSIEVRMPPPQTSSDWRTLICPLQCLSIWWFNVNIWVVADNPYYLIDSNGWITFWITIQQEIFFPAKWNVDFRFRQGDAVCGPDDIPLRTE